MRTIYQVGSDRGNKAEQQIVLSRVNVSPGPGPPPQRGFNMTRLQTVREDGFIFVEPNHEIKTT